jgi:hypothetical protein
VTSFSDRRRMKTEPDYGAGQQQRSRALSSIRPNARASEAIKPKPAGRTSWTSQTGMS